MSVQERNLNLLKVYGKPFLLHYRKEFCNIESPSPQVSLNAEVTREEGYIQYFHRWSKELCMEWKKKLRSCSYFRDTPFFKGPTQ